ncbi:MAG: ABC transporter substrate-binding protein, partial [Deinococcus-Thermus bacterium]|nr:ABC transporter substrate-binding protein [Deinococcota bacterium]
MLAVAGATGPAAAQTDGRSADADWQAVRDAAEGQTVYFNAWGGADAINDYIAWAGEQTMARYGVELVHVRVADIAETVSRILAEKTAGRTDDGSVDLVWINGENFAAMKENDLLGAPFVEALPNFDLVDTAGKPTTLVDFTVPTDGLEAPWGMAQLVFMHDTHWLPEAPASLTALAEGVGAGDIRFTYPRPPAFLGTTFLKQALITLADDPAVLQEPASAADIEAVTAPLWAFLDALHPHLWRGGRAFPENGPAMLRLLDDGEVDVAFSFNPAEASAAIENGELPETVRTFVFDGGMLGNTHFVAIPFNASAREGAMVVANFLLSPEAQARKADPTVWGDPTVLDVAALPEADRALFDALPRGVATLSPEALGPTLPEPHPSWTDAIEAEW